MLDLLRLGALLALVGIAYAQNQSGLYNCLNQNGIPYLTSNSGSNWNSAKKAFNQRLQYTPIAIAKPTTTTQVSKAVTCGLNNFYYVNARGGGHSYAANAFGGENNHFMIDMAAFNTISVYGSRALVGGGVRLGDLGLALGNKGRAVANGVCPYVGIGGHATYGGQGYFSRSWGMLSDQVNSIQVVTYEGQVRNVSASNGSDLFWALRGAGGSFGIVTAFELNTQPMPSQTVYSTYNFNDLSASSAANVIYAYQFFTIKSAVPAWGSTLDIKKGSKQNTISLTLQVTWLGSQTDFQSVVKGFLSQVPTPSASKSTPQSYLATLQSLAGNQNLNTSLGSDYTDTFYAKSVMTPESQPLTLNALQQWTNYMTTTGYNSDTSWFAQVELYGGPNSAINKPSSSATAFVHRSSHFTIQFYASSSTYGPPYPSDGFSFVGNMVNSLTQAMGSSWPYEAYQNYIDTQLSNSQAIGLYWLGNYPQLQSLKKKYDPRNVFRVSNAQAIIAA